MRAVLTGLTCAALLTLPAGCEEECEVCTDAIEHMASKAKDNGCAPSVMQNAVQRIRSECDNDLADFYVGQVVEACQADWDVLAVCDLHTQFVAHVTLINGLGEEVRFFYQYGENGDERDTLLRPGGSAPAILRVLSGRAFIVRTEDSNGVPLGSTEVPLVLRTTPAAWEPWQPRTITIVPGPIPGSPPEIRSEHFE